MDASEVFVLVLVVGIVALLIRVEIKNRRQKAAGKDVAAEENK